MGGWVGGVVGWGGEGRRAGASAGARAGEGGARASRPIGRVMHDPRQRTFVRRGGVFHRLHEAEELVELGVGVRVVPVAVRVEQVGEVRGPLRIVRLRRHRGGPRQGRVRDSSDERSRRSAMTRSDENGIERREIPRRGPRSRTRRGGGGRRVTLSRGETRRARAGGGARGEIRARDARARRSAQEYDARDSRDAEHFDEKKIEKNLPARGIGAFPRSKTQESAELVGDRLPVRNFARRWLPKAPSEAAGGTVASILSRSSARERASAFRGVFHFIQHLRKPSARRPSTAPLSRSPAPRALHPVTLSLRFASSICIGLMSLPLLAHSSTHASA